MNAPEHALARVSCAEESLRGLEQQIELTLKNKLNVLQLRIDVAVFIEHLRAALDYIAGYVYREFVSDAPEPARIYFPMAVQDSEFSRGWLRDLAKVRPDLLEPIMAVQREPWLRDLKILSNKCKHVELAAQEWRRQTRVRELPLAAYIKRHVNRWLRDDFPQDVDLLPGNWDVPEIIEESYIIEFADTGCEVLSFLKAATRGVRSIIDHLAATK